MMLATSHQKSDSLSLSDMRGLYMFIRLSAYPLERVGSIRTHSTVFKIVDPPSKVQVWPNLHKLTVPFRSVSGVPAMFCLRDPRSRFEVCQLPKGLGGSGSWSSGPWRRRKGLPYHGIYLLHLEPKQNHQESQSLCVSLSTSQHSQQLCLTLGGSSIPRSS